MRSRHARGSSIGTTTIVWMLIGLVDAAFWAGVVVVSKHLLRFIDPVVLNLLARAVTLMILVVVGVPLVAVGALPLGFAVTWQAAGYIGLTALVSWFLGYTLYLYALRMGDVSVVAPVGATDPVWTGLFAFVLLGAPIGGLLVAGLVCTTAGVAAVTYWMELRGGAVPLPAEAAGPAGASGLTAPQTCDPARAAAPGETPSTKSQAGPSRSEDDAAARTPGGLSRQVNVVALATTAAAAWGLATILIQQAIAAAVGASITLVLLYEVFGCLMLAPFAWKRRARAFCRPPGAGDRRRLIGLLAAGGVLDSLFIVLFYVVVEQLGAVLANIAIATSPVFSILGGVLLLRERVGVKLALAITLTLAGVFLAVLGSG